MVGTIFGLPLSQQFDSETGTFLDGGTLSIYQAATTTPVDVYEDVDLTNIHEWPLELDAGGRIPEFWLEDGSYRIVLRNSAGVTQFDINSTQALGPSTGVITSSSGVADSQVFTTGDVKWKLYSGTETGWVRLNGRTIGSASSGSTERANADTENLFLWLWNNITDTYAPVSGGRGATAAADWSANKRITLPSMQGRAPFGLDDMGATAAGVLTVGTPTTTASTLGAEKTTFVEANLPAHTHSTGTLAVSSHTHAAGTLAGATASHTHSFSATTSSDGAHTHTMTIRNTTNAQPVTGSGNNAADDSNTTGVTSSDGAHTHTVSGTSGAATPAVTVSGSTATTQPTLSGATGSVGSGTAATTVAPGRLGTWYIKL